MGIDISKQEIEFCKDKGFKVVRSDIFAFLRKTKEKYDAIVLNDIIEHLTKDEINEILKHIHASLTKEGICLIKTFNMANPIMSPSGRYIDFTHEVCFTEESLRQVCLFAGFTMVHILPLDIYVFYTNPLNYIAKFLTFFLHQIFRILFLLYGRKTTHIFTKNILAVCKK